MATISNDNVEDIVEKWDHPIQPTEADNLYKLLEVVASENRRLDIELDELYDNRFLGSATGVELEKIGDLVGINRKTGESDAKLRKRIRAGFAAHASDTTYESFTSAALSILDAGAGSVTFITPPDSSHSKVVELEVDGAVLDESPLTESELIILLNGALSVDARAKIVETGTFAFDGSDASLEGFDEGTWSAGVN
jgi:hypothetical protein